MFVKNGHVLEFIYFVCARIEIEVLILFSLLDINGLQHH